jgi:hypothetical protein
MLLQSGFVTAMLAMIELKILEPKNGAVVPIGTPVNVSAQVSGFVVGVDGSLFVEQNSIGMNRQFTLAAQTLQFDVVGCYHTSHVITGSTANNLLFQATGDFVARCAESAYGKFGTVSLFSVNNGRCEAAQSLLQLGVRGEQHQCGSSGTFAVYHAYVQSIFTGALTYGGDPLPSVAFSIIGTNKETLTSQSAGFELGFFDAASYDLVQAHNMVRTHSGKDALMQALFASAAVGLVLEFGVFKGASLLLIAKFMRGRACHGFDSFRGLSHDWKEGVSQGHFDLGGQMPQLEEGNIALHPGWFNETLPQFLSEHSQSGAGGGIALCHIDCDTFEASYYVLEQLASASGCLLRAGTVLQFDEYLNNRGWEEGEAKAWALIAAKYSIKWRFLGYYYGTRLAVYIESVASNECRMHERQQQLQLQQQQVHWYPPARWLHKRFTPYHQALLVGSVAKNFRCQQVQQQQQQQQQQPTTEADVGISSEASIEASIGQGGRNRGLQRQRSILCGLAHAALQQPGKLQPLQELGLASFRAAESLWWSKTETATAKQGDEGLHTDLGQSSNGDLSVHCALVSVLVNEAVVAMVESDDIGAPHIMLGAAGIAKNARHMAGRCRMLLGQFDLAAAQMARAQGAPSEAWPTGI